MMELLPITTIVTIYEGVIAHYNYCYYLGRSYCPLQLLLLFMMELLPFTTKNLSSVKILVI